MKRAGQRSEIWLKNWVCGARLRLFCVSVPPSTRHDSPLLPACRVRRTSRPHGKTRLPRPTRQAVVSAAPASAKAAEDLIDCCARSVGVGLLNSPPKPCGSPRRGSTGISRPMPAEGCLWRLCSRRCSRQSRSSHMLFGIVEAVFAAGDVFELLRVLVVAHETAALRRSRSRSTCCDPRHRPASGRRSSRRPRRTPRCPRPSDPRPASGQTAPGGSGGPSRGRRSRAPL